jgi:Ca2+-binding EF-hand superfamily protein
MRSKTFHYFLDLLESLSVQESSLEYSRQLLSSHTDFEPYAVFQHLDRSHKGYLIPEDIHDFLMTNGLTQPLEFCSYFLKQFDFDQDRTLVFSE